MEENVTLDDLDLDLINALQVAPRAPHSLLADVVGSSERTVSRRLRRLMDAGALRVIAETDVARYTEGAPVHVQVQCRAGSIPGVLRALSDRPDVRFAASTTGLADIVCEVYPATRAARARLLTTELQSVPGVERLRSYVVLRTYRTAAGWHLHRLGGEQLARLESTAAWGSSGTPEPLSAAESAIIDALTKDARVSNAALARVAALPESTTHRLLHGLLDRGLVRPRADIEPELLGYAVEALLWLSVRPRATERVARELVAHPSMRYVTRITGERQLVAQAVFTDEESLHTFMTEVLETTDDVLHSEISLVLTTAKRWWLVRADGRIVAPRWGGAPGTEGETR
ncbi:Lrp/AsnC family transcriptional regulator [Streptomyces hygroscopicus]|uniref:Lrp/AsnC family transcriptional regulator n=1 Tax=Streptomyces hygroscopicus TaxID=1912 RepID=UPI00362F382A